MIRSTRFLAQWMFGVRVVLLTVLVSSLVACTTAAPTPAPFPTRPITYLIPFDPGGQADRIAQQQVAYLKKSLGQNVTIDYKVGQGGAVGWTELAKSAPDGYTIAAISLPHIVLQPMYSSAGYKTDNLTTVAVFASTPLGLAVGKNSPYKTLAEFLDAARAKPGEITIGGVGEYSGHHMAYLKLQKLSNAKMKYMSFSGTAPQMTAFLGGDVLAVVGNLDDLIKNKDQVKILAMADSTRFAALPDVPTFKEQGLDLVEKIDRGVAVPAGTPVSIVKKLETAFLENARNPEFQAAMQQQGFVPLAMGQAETKTYIEKMVETYRQLGDLVKQP